MSSICPTDATEAAVKDHFNKLFRLDCDGVATTKGILAQARKAAKSVVITAVDHAATCFVRLTSFISQA